MTRRHQGTGDGLLAGRVVIVTGSGRGLGRAYALELAAHGARVVVDVVSDRRSADAVVAAIESTGGSAMAVQCDVADEAAVEAMFVEALDRFGAVNAVVNNAGITRDKMLVNMRVEQWDEVMSVHLRGTFLVTRTAARYWREQAGSGEQLQPRIVNTVSAAGMFGNLGQTNYGAAKAGIATFTVTAAAELARYGITVNALSPNARTDMTAALIPARVPDAPGFDAMAPDNAAPLVTWLCSSGSAAVTGQVFTVIGGRIVVQEGWHDGPTLDLERRWDVGDVAREVPALVHQARPATPVLGTKRVTEV